MEPLSGPIRRVNVDFTAEMLNELDWAASQLNISRQAVIKTLLRQALDQHYLAEGARQKAGWANCVRQSAIDNRKSAISLTSPRRGDMLAAGSAVGPRFSGAR